MDAYSSTDWDSIGCTCVRSCKSPMTKTKEEDQGTQGEAKGMVTAIVETFLSLLGHVLSVTSAVFLKSH